MRGEALFSIGSVGYLLSQAAIIVIVARFGDVGLLGAYGFAAAVLTPLYFSVRLGVDTVLAAGRSSDDEVTRLVSTTTAASLGLAAALILACVVCLVVLKEQRSIIAIFVIVALTRLVENIIYCLNGYRIGNHAHRRAAVTLIAVSVFAPLALAVGYLATGSPILAIAMIPAANLAGFAFFGLSEYRSLKPALFDRRNFAKLVELMPLGASSALSQVQNAAPRVFGGAFLGMDILGALMPAFQIFTLVVATVNAAIQSLLPRIASRTHVDAASAVRTILTYAGILGLALCLVSVPAGFLLGPAIISLVFGSQYEIAALAIGWFAVAWTLRVMAIFLNNIAIIRRDYGALVRQNFYTATIAVMIFPALIALFGTDGIVAGMIATSAFLLARLTWHFTKSARMAAHYG
ncbi:lipopolysaccharide biosynthesis protein [Silicimonas sp. MF1-12-2]|uniref:lipopolysaccharide biosynthesis protein n=1 Tax=Silicimonas sp. MF1-12-2 TaxID=3384793 RepID=UPI0039B647D7